MQIEEKLINSQAHADALELQVDEGQIEDRRNAELQRRAVQAEAAAAAAMERAEAAEEARMAVEDALAAAEDQLALSLSPRSAASPIAHAPNGGG
eukprot:4068204-Prymnesium_polylepis.1